MKKAVCLLLLLSIFSLCGCSDKTSPQEKTIDFFSMNTVVSATVYGEGADSVLDEVRFRTIQLENKWSATLNTSEVYAINHANGNAVTVSGDTLGLIDFSLNIARKTDGAFEPTIYPIVRLWGFTTGEFLVPTDEEIASALLNVGYDKVIVSGSDVSLRQGMSLDFGAVGKGYALDETLKILRKANIASGMINFGGNIGMIGTKPDGSEWKIGVTDPSGGGNIGTLLLSDCAIATSGNYQRYFEHEGIRYGHIMNPITGRPQDSDILSVSVVSKDGKVCDALATAIYVMGADKAIEFWKAEGGFEMLLVLSDNTAYITEGILSDFENTSLSRLNTITRQEV